jgi:hypothetical protein
MDDIASELQIPPWQANRFQPAELFTLMRGRQRQWNRQCLLTAWSTYIIASAFGAFEHINFSMFLERYSPPGYVPEKQRERAKPADPGRVVAGTVRGR